MKLGSGIYTPSWLVLEGVNALTSYFVAWDLSNDVLRLALFRDWDRLYHGILSSSLDETRQKILIQKLLGLFRSIQFLTVTNVLGIDIMIDLDCGRCILKYLRFLNVMGLLLPTSLFLFRLILNVKIFILVKVERRGCVVRILFNIRLIWLNIIGKALRRVVHILIIPLFRDASSCLLKPLLARNFARRL